MNTKEMTLEQVIARGESAYPQITALYQWSENYHAQEGPMTLFLDLIGYSDEQIGVKLYNMDKMALGYLELDYLGDALKEYASRGESAYKFVCDLLDAEGRHYEEGNE